VGGGSTSSLMSCIEAHKKPPSKPCKLQKATQRGNPVPGGYNWATLTLGDTNTWFSRSGAGCSVKNYCCKIQEVKTKDSLQTELFCQWWQRNSGRLSVVPTKQVATSFITYSEWLILNSLVYSLSLLIRALLGKLPVSHSRISQHFMEPKGSLLYFLGRSKS
jgi:hypothetical protein